MFFHPLWTVIYLMLISSNGFFFLGALPPTQLMGLTGTGQAADDTRWGLDPAQPPRENAWGRTASQEESRAQLCPAHTTAGGSLGCPSGPGQARGASQPHPMSQAWGCVPARGCFLCPAAPTLCEQSLCKWFCSSGVLFSPLWRDLRLLLGGIINQRIN